MFALFFFTSWVEVDSTTSKEALFHKDAHFVLCEYFMTLWMGMNKGKVILTQPYFIMKIRMLLRFLL